ncbi:MULTISPECIES: RloB family protein [unclassified Saccharothrix]|uniref:RloB family protein n=1 Tax=unclassified Saccharothrix TaxID=2593673 RepID=UPI00307F5F6E
MTSSRLSSVPAVLMARREPSRRRRPPHRQPANRILVVCCGNTEKLYFEGLKRSSHLTALKVVTETGSPEQLVDYAVTIRRRAEDGFDQVWCVVDVDEFDVPKAIAAAEQTAVALAISDPCFELWLLLHFRGHNAYIDGARAAKTLLTGHIAAYDKKIDFKVFAPNIDDAIARAKLLGPDNPTTGVWRLVEAALGR